MLRYVLFRFPLCAVLFHQLPCEVPFGIFQLEELLRCKDLFKFLEILHFDIVFSTFKFIECLGGFLIFEVGNFTVLL